MLSSVLQTSYTLCTSILLNQSSYFFCFGLWTQKNRVGGQNLFVYWFDCVFCICFCWWFSKSAGCWVHKFANLFPEILAPLSPWASPPVGETHMLPGIFLSKVQSWQKWIILNFPWVEIRTLIQPLFMTPKSVAVLGSTSTGWCSDVTVIGMFICCQYAPLLHVYSPGSYARILFVDFGSALNTFIPALVQDTLWTQSVQLHLQVDYRLPDWLEKAL